MASASPVETLPGRDSGSMRVYCSVHNLGFSAPRGTRIQCEVGGHELDRGFPHTELWEYCCDCQHYSLIDTSKSATAEPECPACERKITRRFVCAACQVISFESDSPGRRKVYSLSTQGTPKPACPGCVIPAASGLHHECPDFGGSFVTSRLVCPFCDEALEPPPSFPCSVARYLEKLKSSHYTTKFEPESNLLVESPTGDYVLVERVRGSALPIVVPKAASIASKQDYYNTYYELFNCDNPAAGEVIILSPAVVEKSDDGWLLREAGFIDIKPDQTAPVTTPLTQATIKCQRCGTAGKPEHAFCNKCGSPMGPTQTDDSTLEDDDLDTTKLETQFATDADRSSTSGFSNYPVMRDTPAATVAANPARSGAKIIIGVIVGLAVLAIAITFLSTGGNSVEKKLDSALARGNLFAPGSENARDLYFELKNSGASEETLKRYREKLTPPLTNPGYQLTEKLMQIGYDEPGYSEWDEAGRKLDWAVEINPENSSMAARAAYCKGRSAYLQKQHDSAAKWWTRAADLDKSWVLPVNGLGMVYTAERDFGTARSYFFQALKRDANWPFPNENIGNTYWEEKNYPIAKEFYNKAIANTPNWAKPHMHLAYIAMVEKDWFTAVSEFETALGPNAIGLKGNEPAIAQRALEKARQKLSEQSNY